VMGGVLYEFNPVTPFLVMSAGMAIVTLWAYLKVRDPEELFL
jgi:hypothetical protein